MQPLIGYMKNEYLHASGFLQSMNESVVKIFESHHREHVSQHNTRKLFVELQVDFYLFFGKERNQIFEKQF